MDLMMQFQNRNVFILVILLFLFSFSNPTSLYPNQKFNGNPTSEINYKVNNVASEINFILPFDGLFFSYGLNIKYINYTIPQINLNVDYSKINSSEAEKNGSNQFDYVQKMVFKSWLFSLIGIYSENVTFYENSSSRELVLIGFEGSYIPRYIEGFSAYNLSGKNWDPFWIVPKAAIGDSVYPIYSFSMPFNKTLILPPNSLKLFDEPRPIMTFNSRVEIIDTNLGANFTHNLGLIYDNLTGVLLNGFIASSFKNATNTYTYLMEMNLEYSNVFERYSDYLSSITTSSTSTSGKEEFVFFNVPPPNYLILGIIILSPLLVLGFKFVKLKEIEGGSQ